MIQAVSRSSRANHTAPSALRPLRGTRPSTHLSSLNSRPVVLPQPRAVVAAKSWSWGWSLLTLALLLCGVTIGAAHGQAISYKTVLWSGDAAPGLPAGSTITNLGYTAINNAGQVVIRANVTVGGQGKVALWTGTPDALSLALLSGQTIAGAPAEQTFFNVIYTPVINDAGQTLVWVGMNAGNQYRGLIFLDHGVATLIAEDGQIAPGISPPATFSFQSTYYPCLNSSGRVLFNASAGTTSGLWWGTPDSIQKLASPGDGLVGAPTAWSLRNDRDLAVYSDGAVLVSALPGPQRLTVLGVGEDLRGGGHIIGLGGAGLCDTDDYVVFIYWSQTAGNPGSGVPAWNGCVFANGNVGVLSSAPGPSTPQGPPVYSDAHVGLVGLDESPVSPRHSMVKGDSRTGLFARIAVRGGPVPGSSFGAVYWHPAATQIPFGYWCLNRRGQAAFSAVTNNSNGYYGAIVIEAPDGSLHAAAETNSVMTVRPGVQRTVHHVEPNYQYSGGSDGHARSWNDLGQAVFTVYFTDGTSAIMIAQFCTTGPTITANPLSVQAALGGSASFTATGSSDSNLTYRWRHWVRQGNVVTPVNMADSDRITGSGTSTLTISQIQPGDATEFYDCLISNACGSVASNGAAITINYCPSDLDDGTGSGTPDGGVDINDLLFFLSAFEAGTANADLDNGSGTGTPDGGVDINDLLFFLTHFEAGC